MTSLMNRYARKITTSDKMARFFTWQLPASERGKERRLVLRLAVTLFLVYSYIWCQLFQSEGPVPRVTPKPYMKYAINLMTYFQQQRKEIDKVQMSNALLKKIKFIQKCHVCLLPNPFADYFFDSLTLLMDRNYYNCFPSR